MLILSIVLLMCDSARAGWIEDRADGATVIHIKVFALPDPTATDGYNRAEAAGVREFKGQFSEIFSERYRDRYRADPARYGNHNWDRVLVELHQAAGINVEGIQNDLLAIAGGMAPDVMQLTFRQSYNYIRSGFLYPLDKVADGYLSAMTTDEVDFRIHPKLWSVIRRKGPDGDEHVWAMPYGGALGKVLVYRKELFDRHDIPYPDNDWTWNDLYEAARAITDPDEGVYGLLFGSGNQEAWFWITFLWSAGGEVMTYDDASDQWLCTFDSREAAIALDFYTKLTCERWVDGRGKTHRGYALKDWTSRGLGWTKYDRGQIGMIFDQVDEKLFSRIDPERQGMAPVPLGPTGQRGAELNSRMMGLFSGIDHPAVRDAAWEYIRFYDSEEAARVKTRVMVENGLGPFINPQYLRRFGYTQVEQMAPKGWAETFAIAIANGKPEPYGNNSSYVYDIMTSPTHEAEHLALSDQLPQDREQRLDVLQGLLRRANARANEQMLGVVSPQERWARDLTAIVLLLTMAVTFAAVMVKVVRTFAPPGEQSEATTFRRNLHRNAWAYALLAPALLTILFWQYLPLAQGSLIAFQDYGIIGKSAWAGVRNFGDALWDSYWWQSLWNATRYCFLVLAFTFLPPIALAVLLQEIPRGKLTFRTVFYLPAVVTGLVTTLLWKQFYEASELGVLNRIIMRVPAVGFLLGGIILLLVALLFARRLWRHQQPVSACFFVLGGLALMATCMGMAGPILVPPGESFIRNLAMLPSRLANVTPEPYRWLSDPQTAMLACVVPMVWAGIGPGCLIYLAALKGIPDELYEAADLDGASFVDKILLIVFPILKPLILINFVGAFIGAWYGATANILAMTGGGANTEVAGLYIFYKAFVYLKFGSATAMAWMLAFLLIGFTVYQLRILSQLEFRTTGD